MFDPTLPVVVSANASDCGLGAVLQQADWHQLHTFAFASRNLSSAETKYAVAEWEALAWIWACERSLKFSFTNKIFTVEEAALNIIVFMRKVAR